MKIKLLSLVILIISAIALFASETILEFIKANSDGSAITVQWKSKDESGIQSFSLERAGSDQIFESISTEQAKGYPSTYTFVDETAFKAIGGENKTLSKSTFYYRIAINKKDNTTSYSDYTTVSHNTSSMRRTWGMLKEMFR